MSKRKSIRQMRRRELIEATRDVISEVGFEGATIARISSKAGFSIGYLHHHFANKDALLAEAIRVLYGDMRSYLATTLPTATHPLDRFLIVLDANFREPQFTRNNAFAWISFLARVPFNPEFVRLQTVIERRLFSNLHHDLGQVLPPREARIAVEEISTLIDGYWVRLGVSPDGVTSEHALREVLRISDRLLDGALRQHFNRLGRHVSWAEIRRDRKGGSSTRAR